MLALHPLRIPEPPTVFFFLKHLFKPRYYNHGGTIVGKTRRKQEQREKEAYLQLVHINLDELHIRVFGRELFEGWLNESTWSTPCCREINHQLQHQKNK
jgi:hypothetical protein